MTREAQEGATHEQIGDKREQNCDRRRLDRIEGDQHLPLVDDIHDHAKDDDPRRGEDSLPQTSAAPLLVPNATDQRPDIWPTPEPGVANAIARRRNDRHRRLQYEAERHWTAWPIKNVSPQSAEILERDAVPGNPQDDEAEKERHGDSRREDRALRWRISQGSAPL